MLCSVVCITLTGKVLVAKSNNNAIIPGLWSCGIFRVGDFDMLENAAREYYMREFNADIDIIYQTNGESNRPIPISIFTVTNGPKNSYENGVYIAAFLRNPLQLMLNNEYSEVRVLDLVELATEIGNTGIVPDLYFNIMTSFEAFLPEDSKIKVATDPTDELDIDQNNDQETMSIDNLPFEEELDKQTDSTDEEAIENSDNNG